MHATRRLAPALAVLVLAFTASPATAGDWLEPVHLEDLGVVIPEEEPLVAMAADGDATIVWTEVSQCARGFCDETQIRARQVRADGSRGTSWTLTEDNTTPDAPNDAENPQLAVDAAGRARAAWLRPDATGTVRAEMVRLDAGGTPTGPADPVSPAGQNAGVVALGMNAAGEGVVAWTDNDGFKARRFDPTGFVAGPVIIDPTPSNHLVSMPVVAVDDAGAVTFAWTDIEAGVSPGAAMVKARRLSATGLGLVHELDAWPQSIADPVTMDVHPATGRATILWAHFTDSGFLPESVRGAHVTAADAREAFPLPVAFDEPGAPDVAVAADGSAVGVFDMRVQPGPTKNIVAKRITAAGLASGPLIVSQNGREALDPQVDVTPDGTAFVGWHEENSPRTVMAARIPAGGAPEPPETLASGLKTGPTAAIAADRGGSAIAAFAPTRPGEEFVLAEHFDGEPPAIATFGVPARGYVGQELWFGADERDDLSPIVESTWTLGDGATGSQPVLSHAFGRPGTFAITLRVTDAVGNTSTRSGSVAISALVPPQRGGTGQQGGVKPPSFTVGMLRARVARRTLLRRGLSVGLTASTPTAFAVQLVGRLRGARLATTGDLVLAERQLAAAAGTRTARLKVSRTLRRLVRGGTKLRVRITATGADGGTATATKRIRVRK